MTKTKRLTIRLIILLVTLRICIPCFAQLSNLDPEKWVAELSKKDPDINENYLKLERLLETVDSTHAFKFLDDLAEKGKSKGFHFHARYNCLRAAVLYVKNAYYEFYQQRKNARNFHPAGLIDKSLA